MRTIRKIARILTLPVCGQERRKDARASLEKFLHKLFKTEYYRCERVYEQMCAENKQIGFERYHLLSLGYNCFGRMTFNYWGLKPRKADGEKTMPFDISVHPLDTVTALLQNRFAGYFDNLEYSLKDNCWKNTGLNITFVHDHENDRHLFEERYKTRIDNFYQAVEDDKPCLFFAYADKEVSAESINRLYAAVSEICAHKPCKLVFMIFNHPVPEGINGDVAVYRADYPQGYVHMDKFTKYTTAGLSFEKKVVDFTRGELEKLLNKKA